MSIYLIIMLLLVGAVVAMFLKNMAMAKELSKFRTRMITLELERDRQIRMGVFK